MLELDAALSYLAALFQGQLGRDVADVAGSGAGEEADRLRTRMLAMAPTVVLHGQLSQAALAELMRTCAVFVLPSFYEGLGLVLVEALACGCRLVATALPGVQEQLAPLLGPALQKVAMPRMVGRIISSIMRFDIAASTTGAGV